VSGAPKHGGGSSSPGAGGLGVKTPSKSRETGGGRFYALKTPSRAAIPLASRTLTEPVPLKSLPLANRPQELEKISGGVGEADARDSVRRPPPPPMALLSIGHIATPAEHQAARQRELAKAELMLHAMAFEAGRPPAPKPLVIWVEGSRVDIPKGIPPDALLTVPPRPPVGQRGSISEFSDKSRRRLQKELATRKREAEVYTMALTLPGDFSHLPPETVMDHFRKLQRRFDRNPSFKGVAVDWKREPQMREALHYHLLFYGLDDASLREMVRHWFVTQWNALCCQGMDAKAREHHRWFHARDANFQKVRAFAGYFAKYVGKASGVSAEYPGRWWGSWNKAALPISEKLEVALAPVALHRLRRIARKLRQNQANEAKHRKIVAKLGVRQISRWGLQCMRMNYTLQGFRPESYMTGPNQCLLSGQEIAACFDSSARAHGLRFGKSKRKLSARERREQRQLPASKRREIAVAKSNAPISLLGELAPSSMLRALEWVRRT
jgi:hypothetical protein